MDSIIRTPTLEDIVTVSRGMRVADVEEVRAASGKKPFAALFESVQSAHTVWCAVSNDVPYAIFGVSPFVNGTGSPWLLATDDLTKKHKRFFLSVTPYFVGVMNKRFPVLVNYVDARHTESVRWLRRSGFKIDAMELTHGFERRPFFRFSKVQHV